jgi:hypothetical protein
MLMYLLASDVEISLEIDDSRSSSHIRPSQTCHDCKRQERIFMRKITSEFSLQNNTLICLS